MTGHLLYTEEDVELVARALPIDHEDGTTLVEILPEMEGRHSRMIWGDPQRVARAILAALSSANRLVPPGSEVRETVGPCGAAAPSLFGELPVSCESAAGHSGGHRHGDMTWTVSEFPAHLRGDGPCQDCGTLDNISWFTESVFWNDVVKRHGPDKILCIPCFVIRTDAVGYFPTGWRLLPDFHWETTAEREARRSRRSPSVPDTESEPS